MTGLGRRGMFYLAAAVSDFFLPLDRMVSHSFWSGGEESGRVLHGCGWEALC